MERSQYSQLNLLLTRIDNRLVHGQVGVTWTKTIGATMIVVCDDEVASNILQQKLMEIVAYSSGTQIRFFSVQTTIEKLKEATADQKLYLVVRNIPTVRRLVESRLPICDLNIGNLHFERGKKQLSTKVYLSEQDSQDLSYLLEQQVHIFVQDVPGDTILKVKPSHLQF